MSEDARSTEKPSTETQLIESTVAKRRNMYIRQFRRRDLAAVRELIYNTIDVCYSADYPKEAIKFFKEYHCDENILKGAADGWAIVLEKDNRIIATGTIVDDHIMRVFVNPKFQKRGLGKLIMRKLEDKAISSGVNKVKLDASLPSKKFYDSLGYATSEATYLDVENDKKLHYYKMNKRLMSVTQIDNCRQADFEQVFGLLEQLWPAQTLDKKRLRGVFKQGLKSKFQCYVCARIKGNVVGFISLTIKNSLWQQGYIGHIDELIVGKQYRGRGIGSQLLEYIANLAKKKGCSRIELDSAFTRKNAHKFYKRNGFENRAFVFSKEIS
jgi:GNAT superfamily N-acetyltransferase